MKFILSNTFKSISKNLKINVIIVFTLFVAYLFFFLGCCYIEDGFRDLNSFKQTRMESSIRYESRPTFLESKTLQKISKEDFGAFFQQYGFVENATIIEKNHAIDELTGEALNYHLILDSYSEFFLLDIISGRYFTQDELQNGAQVCVVEKTYQDLNGVSIGDFFTIGDVELEIIGVIKRNANAGTVFAPYNTIKTDEVRDQHFQGYIVAAQLTDQAQRFDIQWSQLNLNGELCTAREFYNNGLRFLLNRSSVIFVACVILLFYALLNMINIMTSKLDAQKKSFGIRVALGASQRQIFLQFFFECLILALVAVCFVFLIDPVIGPVIKTIINHYFGVYSAVAMLLTSVASSFFISLVLLRKFKKMNVVEIIKDL